MKSWSEWQDLAHAVCSDGGDRNSHTGLDTCANDDEVSESYGIDGSTDGCSSAVKKKRFRLVGTRETEAGNFYGNDRMASGETFEQWIVLVDGVRPIGKQDDDGLAVDV